MMDNYTTNTACVCFFARSPRDGLGVVETSTASSWKLCVLHGLYSELLTTSDTERILHTANKHTKEQGATVKGNRRGRVVASVTLHNTQVL